MDKSCNNCKYWEFNKEECEGECTKFKQKSTSINIDFEFPINDHDETVFYLDDPRVRLNTPFDFCCIYWDEGNNPQLEL